MVLHRWLNDRPMRYYRRRIRRYSLIYYMMAGKQNIGIRRLIRPDHTRVYNRNTANRIKMVGTCVFSSTSTMIYIMLLKTVMIVIVSETNIIYALNRFYGRRVIFLC